MNKYHLAVLLIVLPLASCGEDPKLIEKRDKQKVEIARLNGELQIISEKLKGMPADVSEELAVVKKQTAVQQEEVANLETEVAQLEKKKAAIQMELDAYRAKYPLK